MKKCFENPSVYCRSVLSFQVGTLLGYFNTVSSVKIKTGVYRNCYEVVAKTEQWGRGGMVDTLVLGTSLFGGGSSSLLDPTKSEKNHLSIITKLFISDLGIWLGLMWTKPLGSNRYTFLQGI